MRAAVLLVGFGTALGLRVLLGGDQPAAAVGAALVFATALLLMAAAARTPIALTRRGLLLGLLGWAVLCLPVLLDRVITPEPLRSTAGFWPWIAAVTVVVAAEEVFLRGALFDAFSRPWVGVLVGAVCFALLHVPLYGWHVVPLDLAVGVVLGGLRHESGTVLAPFLAHLGADGVGWFVS